MIYILTGFIIGYMDCWIHMLYIKQSIYVIPLVNHFRRITGATQQITILIEHLGCDINNNSHADSNE